VSTRCQIRIIQEGLSNEDSVTLYHHWDGYPENMIKLFKSAFEKIGTDSSESHSEPWKSGRAGKCASYLCAVDPGGFEPEEGHALHFDIAYYYRIFCENQRKEKERTIWEVEILKPTEGFWDNPDEEHLKVIQKRTSLMDINEMKIDEIE